VSANLDLVRSIFGAWERGDYRTVDWAHPESEFAFADGPEPGNWKGLAGMAEGFQGWSSVWEELRVTADEYRELDDERVLVLSHTTGRGKTSGLEIGQMQARSAHLFHIKDGKVTRYVGYFNAERGLADLGLSSDPAPSGT
jgi:ketosteroid isomerase-like protein